MECILWCFVPSNCIAFTWLHCSLRRLQWRQLQCFNRDCDK